MHQLTLDAPTSWVVMTLIAFLAGYNIQTINRLKDLPPGDPRRESPKYYPIITWLSWATAILFVTIFALIIRIILVLPLHLRRIFDYINIYIVIGSFVGSQTIHLGIFLWSYGEDIMRYFEGRHDMPSDNYRRKALVYEKAAENYKKAGDMAKAKEARKRAADNYEKEAERKIKAVKIAGFRVRLTIYLVVSGCVLSYVIFHVRPIVLFLVTLAILIVLLESKFFGRRKKQGT